MLYDSMMTSLSNLRKAYEVQYSRVLRAGTGSATSIPMHALTPEVVGSAQRHNL